MRYIVELSNKIIFEYVTGRRGHLVKRHKTDIFEKHYGMDLRALQYMSKSI